jgi:vomeronasal1 receptor
MIPEDLAMGVLLSFQKGLGIRGNWSLLFHFVFSVFTGKFLKPKDMIVKHLTFANSLAIITKGIPQTMTAFDLKYFLHDIGCKLVLYLYTAGQGISLHIKHLLSCFQAITISSNNTRWMKMKQSQQVHWSLLFTQLACTSASKRHDYHESDCP